MSTIKMQNALQSRTNSITSQTKSEAQYTIVDGAINIQGEGVGTIDIVFPCVFVEDNKMPPRFVASGTVGTNNTIDTSNYPYWDVGVLRWKCKYRPNAKPLYVGMTVVIKCAGIGLSVVTWQCSGTALTAGASNV